jgi:DTW domain-containing protein YfiP
MGQSAHLIEGTHIFQVRLYLDPLPIEGLADYEQSQFSLQEVRKYPAVATVKHTSSVLPRWQKRLIETLSDAPFNLYIDPIKVLSPADYQRYIKIK